MEKNVLKAQTGAISVFVMISMMFFVVTIIGVYMISSKRAQSQTEAVEITQEIYNQIDAQSLYESKIAGTTDVIPIYTKEQLWLAESRNSATSGNRRHNLYF